MSLGPIGCAAQGVRTSRRSPRYGVSRAPEIPKGSIMKHAIFAGVVASALGLAMATSALAADISGAGSTFIYPVFAKWADTYKTATGTGLNYQSIGSGGGIKQVEVFFDKLATTEKP